MCYLDTTEFYAGVKKNAIMKFVEEWIKLEKKLSEIILAKKHNSTCFLSHMDSSLNSSGLFV